MFTMLCLAKLSNLKNPNNNGWVNVPIRKIFKLASIYNTTYEQDLKINKLLQLDLIELQDKNNNSNVMVKFIKNDEELLIVSDFRELGYEYQKYKGENFIRCAECGILTRGSKNGMKRYCKKCCNIIPMRQVYENKI